MRSCTASFVSRGINWLCHWLGFEPFASSWAFYLECVVKLYCFLRVISLPRVLQVADLVSILWSNIHNGFPACLAQVFSSVSIIYYFHQDKSFIFKLYCLFSAVLNAVLQTAFFFMWCEVLALLQCVLGGFILSVFVSLY